jgi:excinuclease UvrABC nuclease subunit
MSDQDQALNDAKLKSLEEQNVQLQTQFQSLVGQLRARKIQADEQFEQNAQFRTSIILLEEAFRKAQIDLQSANERIAVIEKEKAALQSTLDGNGKKEKAA